MLAKIKEADNLAVSREAKEIYLRRQNEHKKITVTSIGSLSPITPKSKDLKKALRNACLQQNYKRGAAP